MRTIYDNVFSSTNPKEVLNFKLEENLMPKRNDGSFFDKDIPYTPVGLCDEIFNMIEPIKNKELDTKIAVFYSVEMAIWLHFYGFKDVTVITKNHDKYIADRVGTFCYKYLLLDKAVDMKFDVVVGNPPFNSAKLEHNDNTKSLYVDFTLVAFKMAPIVSLVLPAVFVSDPKRKITKAIIARGIQCCYECSQYFSISQPTLWFISDKTKKTKTWNIRNSDGLVFDTEPTDTIPVFENPVSLSIMNKLRMTSNNRMSSIHQYGVSSLCRNNKLLGAGDNDIAVITGKAGEPVEITKTTADCSSYRHIDSWKVITNQNGGIRTIGAMKILPPGIAATFNIVSFEAHSEAHATNMLNYLETNFVSFLISKVKRMQVNSQTVFNAIPLLDFNINWTDEMLYSYFNLSADEISLITG